MQTKKPKFAAAHRVTITSGTETLDLGEARYVSKPNENMEYLNLVVPYETLTKMTGTNAVLRFGDNEFKFTSAQQKSVANFIKISNPAAL